MCVVAAQTLSVHVCQVFFPFLVKLCAFAQWTFSSFYVLDTNPLTVIRVANIFFLLAVYFLFSLIASSDEKSFLILVMIRFISLTL